jgi:hypothetical protein
VLNAVYAASCSKAFASRSQSTKSAAETLLLSMPWRGLKATRRTRRSACGYGSGVSSTAFRALKIAVLAPMPSVSVATTTAVNAGALSSVRAA